MSGEFALYVGPFCGFNKTNKQTSKIKQDKANERINKGSGLELHLGHLRGFYCGEAHRRELASSHLGPTHG